MDENRQADAKYNADYGEMVKIGTDSGITIWWTFVFPNQKSLYLSHKLIYTVVQKKRANFGGL